MLDKAIKHNKEFRKPYKGAQAIDLTCRNHGTCNWCKDNRTHTFKRNSFRCQDELDCWEEESNYLFDEREQSRS